MTTYNFYYLKDIPGLLGIGRILAAPNKVDSWVPFDEVSNIKIKNSYITNKKPVILNIKPKKKDRKRVGDTLQLIIKFFKEENSSIGEKLGIGRAKIVGQQTRGNSIRDILLVEERRTRAARGRYSEEKSSPDSSRAENLDKNENIVNKAVQKFISGDMIEELEKYTINFATTSQTMTQNFTDLITFITKLKSNTMTLEKALLFFTNKTSIFRLDATNNGLKSRLKSRKFMNSWVKLTGSVEQCVKSQLAKVVVNENPEPVDFSIKVSPAYALAGQTINFTITVNKSFINSVSTPPNDTVSNNGQMVSYYEIGKQRRQTEGVLSGIFRLDVPIAIVFHGEIIDESVIESIKRNNDIRTGRTNIINSDCSGSREPEGKEERAQAPVRVEESPLRHRSHATVTVAQLQRNANSDEKRKNIKKEITKLKTNMRENMMALLERGKHINSIDEGGKELDVQMNNFQRRATKIENKEKGKLILKKLWDKIYGIFTNRNFLKIMTPYLIARKIPVIGNIVLFIEGNITYYISPYVLGASAVGGLGSLGFVIYARYKGSTVEIELGRITPKKVVEWLMGKEHEKTEGGYKKGKRKSLIRKSLFRKKRTKSLFKKKRTKRRKKRGYKGKSPKRRKTKKRRKKRGRR